MKAEGRGSKRPLTEAFGQWANLKIAILALLAQPPAKRWSGTAASSSRCSS